MTITLKPEPLTRERFRIYGDVIETSREMSKTMNDARFELFGDLCKIDMAKDGNAVISIARCRTPTTLPLRLDIVERHPLGSQAFVPLSPCKMVIVVGPPGEAVVADELRAFVTNGRQGLNYHRGTWHMPLISFESGQEYLVIDRGGNEVNCEEHSLEETIFLEDD